MSSGSLGKQRGFVFKLMHSMLIVVGVIALVLLYKAGKLPFINYRPSLPNWGSSSSSSSTHNYSDDVWEPSNNYVRAQQRRSVPVVREQEDTEYTTNRYAVQVAAGYDSRQLYGWRDELLRDGYNAYVVSLNTPRGLMFKLRVGAYVKRPQAEALRDKLSRRYPSNFGESFVVEGD